MTLIYSPHTGTTRGPSTHVFNSALGNTLNTFMSNVKKANDLTNTGRTAGRIGSNISSVSSGSSGSGGSGGSIGSNVSGVSVPTQSIQPSSTNTALDDAEVGSVDWLSNQNLSGTDYEAIANKNNQLSIAINRENNEFNADQAELQRAWSERMSNTAHTREVQDLKRAGLNPILSANAGASTPSGASANASNNPGLDMSIVNALAGVTQTQISAEATKAAASMNAGATTAAAAMQAAAVQNAAYMNSQAQMYASDNTYRGNALTNITNQSINQTNRELGFVGDILRAIK